MIERLEERRWLWDHRGARGPESGHDLHDSLPYPFEDAGIRPIFKGKKVLEIGPGNGRQYERVMCDASLYSICDIALTVLSEPVFSDVSDKFLVEDWGQSFGKSFDVIHFWYVLHHIRQDEMKSFFRFVERHLNRNGLVAFNCPQLINVQGAPEGDGLGTTYSDPTIVSEMAAPLEIIVSLHLDKKSTGYVFLLRSLT